MECVLWGGTYAALPVSIADNSQTVPQVTTGALVSGNFFRVLDVEPRLGRSFSEEEGRVPGRDAVAVLSDAFWAQRFARDPGAIGRALRVNGVEFKVIGVAPPSFTDLGFGLQPAVFVPLAMWSRVAPGLATDPLASRDARALTVKGRLASGVSIQQASSEAATSGCGPAARP